MNRQDLQNLAEAYSQISEKKKDDSYLETDMKKRQANNEKARKDMEKMGTSMKNPHFEQYTVTNADKKGNTKAYQNFKAGMKKKDGTPMYKAADHMKEGVRDVDPEKGTAERKARLEKKRGMKMDDHPQYKKEEKDPFGRPGGKYGGVPKKGSGYDKAYQANMKKIKELEQKEEVELDENRRAARAAGGFVDDSKKQTDPSKPGFTGISGSIKDIMRQNKEIEAANKKMKKEELEATGKFTAEEIEAILNVDMEEGYKEISFDKHQRMYDRYKKLRSAAVQDARDSGEASGENRRKMGKMSAVIDKSSENLRKKQTKGELTGRGPRKEETVYDKMAKEYVNEVMGVLATPVGAGLAGGAVGAVTGGKKKVKKSLATGTGAAAGAALGGLPGAVIGGLAGNALS